MNDSGSIAAIIPARYASTRFPGKPLAPIAGVSMIQRVYEQAKKCTFIDRVIVATDDRRIFDAVEGFGGEAIMTRDDHASGTDRLAEVAARLPEISIIVNIQGDEPLIDPKAVDSAVEPLRRDSQIAMATAAWRICDPEEIDNHMVVKVVIDRDGFALYFSRHAIPYYRDGDKATLADRAYFGHLGLYVYRRETLLRLAALKPTPLEQAECLEQLRALEHGIKIKVVQFSTRSLAVDVPEDVAKVEAALQVLPV
ncbi:MAG TPA: 3-deoxy-manno-octulosonate cytidylyltransferase [Chroococcales cyanobacterium]